MCKWVILAASCLAFSAATAQEVVEPVDSNDEVVMDEGQGGDETEPPALHNGGCGCGKGKTKTK